MLSGILLKIIDNNFPPKVALRWGLRWNFLQTFQFWCGLIFDYVRVFSLSSPICRDQILLIGPKFSVFNCESFCRFHMSGFPQILKQLRLRFDCKFVRITGKTARMATCISQSQNDLRNKPHFGFKVKYAYFREVFKNFPLRWDEITITTFGRPYPPIWNQPPKMGG